MDLKNLAVLVKNSGETKNSIEKKTGLPQSSISRWLNHDVKPSCDALVKIADYFDVSVDHILGRDVPDLPKNVREVLDVFMSLDDKWRGLALELVLTVQRTAGE